MVETGLTSSTSPSRHGQKISFEVPLDEFSVFLKDGTILSLNMSRPVAGLPRVSDGLTHVVIRPSFSDTIEVRTPSYGAAAGLGHSASYVATGNRVYVMASAHTTTETSWLLVDVDEPVAITHTHNQQRFKRMASGAVEADAATEPSFAYNAAARTLVVHPKNIDAGHHVAIQF
ncbi:hypothetical protein PTSG_03201 [Salpingoeca rosetta]|uniref:Uncharacterized protein n=1 Tax=Salpingoeca rosetta (strain ATCC 50818 / BSB-021) TaxID=946362 RepID=F2U4I3_SALR5|nr:uncharacterized protein PTSG_03201 [Salpingoeca rosetta]EGD82549.1 hypothetical protein PTSG_03201 [Salpingoeca rosetta]|eukprot:XP_004995785.1 hypothetical protein PTSG_03201 [Salpingoeca rosetta]